MTSICQVAKNCQVICQTIGGMFLLLFFSKIKDSKPIFRTLALERNTTKVEIKISSDPEFRASSLQRLGAVLLVLRVKRE
jgi:hypothetical protein